MKCPKCQFANREGAKFCITCGEKLELKCPQCDRALPIEAIFCDECGHNLTIQSEPIPKDLSPEEKLEKIEKYLPKGIAEKILAQRDRIEGERKQVTVMFCDMEGYTGLSEKIDPEEVYSIMDQVYEILIHKVRDYEGTVNEMTGDGIMALFGAPIALEDAPQRAIRSAYAIHREMSRFNQKMKEEKSGLPKLKMRIGIHTGTVVVGTLGNDLRVEFKAVGDTVNLASRMESLAESETTYVTEETFKLTEGFFRFEGLGEKKIKGKEEPINVFRVIAPSTQRTRFDVSTERGLTPFIGRDRELELLLDSFERSKAGRGRAFSIMSEAGVGKSRLLYELRKAVVNEDVTFMEGKSLSYSRGVAYHPVIEIVRANFDIIEGEGDSEIREKLKQGLKVLDVDEASTLPYLLELLSVKESGFDSRSLSPEARKDRIIQALIRITIKASQIRPLVLAFEDLHWIDRSSEDYLKVLLDSIAGARIFLIFTYRPEFVHTWGAKSYHSQVNLNRLSNRESLMMVNHLFDKSEIQDDLEDVILEKTEGVPFFIEEFIRSLKDLKIIERKDNQYLFAKHFLEMTIPSTIQDVIMARVDTLPEGAKELIQTGSVIEREFEYGLIKQVMGLSEQELLSRLSILKDSELIYERGIYPYTTYIFKHALTRETVYDSILSKKKKKLHEDIGSAIEKLYKENIAEYYGVLTDHFIYSQNYAKGAEYCRLAGKKAEKAGSFNDAIAYEEKQINCLGALQQTEDIEKNLINARIKLGLYYVHLAQLPESMAAVEPIIDLATKKNYKRPLSLIYGIIGHYKQFVEEDIPESIEYLEKSLIIGEEIDDNLSLAAASVCLGLCLSMNCEFARALPHLKNVLKINEVTNVSWGIADIKSHLVFLFYSNLGKIDSACETSSEALRIANESADIHSKAHAYTAHGCSYYYKGCLEEAKEYLLKGADFSERVNQLAINAWAHRYLGDTYFNMKEYKKSFTHHEKAIFIYQQGRLFSSVINSYNLLIALGKMMVNGEKAINIDDIIGFYINTKINVYKTWFLHYVCEILLNFDNRHLSEVEDLIQKGIEANKKYGMVWDLAQDYALYGELYKRKGNPSKAREKLTQAIVIFKECGADGWVEKYEKELALLT
ncbi:adenylate/guanylate cyclase domain-containing protein [Thermodesulfobacteriota bacterium]